MLINDAPLVRWIASPYMTEAGDVRLLPLYTWFSSTGSVEFLVPSMSSASAVSLSSLAT